MTITFRPFHHRTVSQRFPAPCVCECTYCGTRTECRTDAAGNPACEVCRPRPEHDIPVGSGFPDASIADIFRRTAAAVRADRTPVTLVPVSYRDTERQALRRCSIFCTPATTVGEFRAWYRRHAVGCVVTAWRAGRQNEGPVFEVRAV